MYAIVSIRKQHLIAVAEVGCTTVRAQFPILICAVQAGCPVVVVQAAPLQNVGIDLDRDGGSRVHKVSGGLARRESGDRSLSKVTNVAAKASIADQIV